ncbi:MAG: short-chain fatty acid transporter [Treponema sp.]|nr:short-chain fatty acid transporter [Treponema sp.]
MAKKRGMLESMANGTSQFMYKFLPDAYLFAVILTIVVFIFATIVHGSVINVVKFWGTGVWGLLAFSMQMVLVLVTGHTLALAAPFRKLLDALSNIPKTPVQGIALVSIVAYVACILNWGFGLVIGAILAKEVARKIKNIDYALLIAAAYSGFVLWHAGFSGSVPLTLANGDYVVGGVTLARQIPTGYTIFAPYNIFIVLVTLVVLPIVNCLMHPKAENLDPSHIVDPAALAEEPPVTVTKDMWKTMTPAEKLENSVVLNVIVAVLGFTYIVYYFGFTKNPDLNLNIVNLIFLMLGILLHGTPRRLLNAVGEAAKGAAGIILQFPFYAGIMGMMVGTNAAGVSLAGVISRFFVSISNERTYPFFTFLSAGVVNFFVPSGGGQWAVQGPIMMPAATDLLDKLYGSGVTEEMVRVYHAKTGMAIAYGDSWTNMIQPFWALPALGIAKLGARDIMGYTLIVLLFSGIIISAGLLLF